MAEYTKQEIFDIITEYLELYGSAVGSEAVHELTPEELTDENLRVLTIPGMRPDTEEWVQTSMRNIMKPVTDAVSDFTTLKAEIILARDSANTAATAASNVNATLVNMTVTITDRTGQPNSVDIGFEMYRTYASVAAMKADAANVPQGKFVIIATDDPTSAENARLYVRNSNTAMSAEPFTFLSDLDQASSAAWADWLNNMKPQIEAAISQALSDHTRADGDHSTALSDHQTATTDHQTATSDHQHYTDDRQTFVTDEAARQSTFETNEAKRQQDFEDAESERMQHMILTQCFVDLDTMCLMFVQPQADTTQYAVVDGDLMITVEYDE